MKRYSFLVTVVCIFVGLLLVSTAQTSAQTIRSDGGFIVIDSRPLSPTNKQVVFVVGKNFSGTTTLQFQTISNEGFVHNYPSLNFPDGLSKGQVIKLWDGEFNVFQTTPWLRFDVSILNSGNSYYTMHMTPVAQSEHYKEPMIYDISEIKINNSTYVFEVNGNFDSREETRVIINNNLVVLGKSILFPFPGRMKFTLTEANREIFPTGKYLLTVCQYYHCDTMVGRHR